MAYSYKGSISFGLVYIPIQLHVCVRKNEISFNQLDKKTMSRIKYSKTNSEGDKVTQSDIIKGYEYEKDKYVIFEDDDFEKIKTKKDKNIIIEEFVNVEEIDPIYFEKSYYVVPTNANKAFKLLLKAMQEEGKAGLSRTVLGTKSTLVVLRARGDDLILNTLFYEEEITKNPIKKIDEEVVDAELSLAKSLINNMVKPFEPSKYTDLYTKKLIEAIQDKIQGKQVTTITNEEIPSITNIMDALKESIENITNA